MLEDLIREAIKGGVVAINLWPVRGGGWQGNVTRDRTAWKIGIDPDPVQALLKALDETVPGLSVAPVSAEDLEDMLG